LLGIHNILKDLPIRLVYS